MATQEMQYTCTACEKFTTVVEVALVAHQAQCDKMEDEKREYRLAVLSLFIPKENIEEALELARTMYKNQNA